MKSGILHRPMAYKHYLAFDPVVLHIDLEMEIIRSKLYLSRLKPYIREFKRQPYPGQSNPSRESRCFDTAFAMASAHDLIYCEGLIVFDTEHGPLPMGHGFNCTRDGFVVDATSVKYQNDPRVHFWGVPIKFDYAQAWHDEVGWHGILDGYGDGTLGRIYTDPVSAWMEKVNG